MRQIYLPPIATLLIFASVGWIVSLPPAQDAARGASSMAAEAQEKQEPDPILRINAGGHTGGVRALAFTRDSKRLCSAGLDKVIQVWNLEAVTRDLRGIYLRERTIRWQVARSLRGSIYATASSPTDDLLAFGGYGAMGRLGEILLVNPINGTLIRPLNTDEKKIWHQQTVCSLAFSADGNRLLSVDVEGAAVLWDGRTQWTPTSLSGRDSETYGAATAQRIQALPKIRPAAILGTSDAVLPVCTGANDRGSLTWKLRLIRLSNLEMADTYDVLHEGLVTALATSPDGSRIASADLRGNLFLWNAVGGSGVRRLQPGAVVLSLAFSPDGKTLVAGTAVDRRTAKSQLQVWDIDRQVVTRRRELSDHVNACSISPDGRRLAYDDSSVNAAVVEPLDGSGKPIALEGKGRKVIKVAFAKDAPYRIAFGTRDRAGGVNDEARLEQWFDTKQLVLGDVATPDSDEWLTADRSHGEWTARPRPDGSLQLFRAGEPKGSVVLDAALLDGRIRCYAWIPGDDGKPRAIAVGTDRQNSLYVFRLVEEGACPLLRHFRGHNDFVTSVGVSHDARYLVSGSSDGTIKVWGLSGFEQDQETEGRFGARLSVVTEEELQAMTTRDLVRRRFTAGQLAVRSIEAGGPLYSRSVRQGDVITQIDWIPDPDSNAIRTDTKPEEILRSLREMPWGTQVAFRTTRNGTARPAFQILPAWRALATLFVSADREWAFWTPEGYYDASINGYTLFGWQVNRGVNRLPDYYRANQFYVELEQPTVMERLLEAGSLQEALRQANVQTQVEPQEALSTLIVSTPRVNIIQPANDVEVRGDATKVIATIDVPAGHTLADTNVYANGVVATRRALVAEKDTENGKELTYEWEVPLTSDRRSLIELIVKTDGDIIATSDVVVRRIAQGEPKRPKIYLLSLGINQYGDPDVPSLRFSVADAESTLQSLRAGSAGLYGLDTATLLTEQEVTPADWGEGLEKIKARLKDRAVADDLLVIFLAGHGITDARSKEYYFLGHEFRVESLADKPPDYSACISRRNLRILDDVSCRKLVILDTCHSGAIRLSRSRDPKAAVRSCQESAIFTMAATTREQLAAESGEWQHGVFTRTLLDGLTGEADKMGDGDGVVTLNEVVVYVQKVVPERAQEIAGAPQNPTVAPDHVLSYTRVPLTRVGDTGGEER